jgi:hypothetical protein
LVVGGNDRHLDLQGSRQALQDLLVAGLTLVELEAASVAVLILARRARVSLE